MKKGKAAKIVSWVIDGLLVAIIGVLVYVQISMLTTRDGNFGVPMAFGKSFLYVATDSMTIPNDDTCVMTGSGIIIEKVNDPSTLQPATPIKDADGKIIDYKLDGDVVTFFWKKLGAPDTHRLIDKEFIDGKWHFRTMGDNPVLHEGYLHTEEWTEDVLIGRKIYHSKWFGDFLTIASPEAAASAGKTAWLMPVAVVVPLLILAAISVGDVFRTAKKEEKEEEEKMLKLMVASGVDPNDEEAAELFRQKEELKIEYRAKMEEEIAKAKKEARKKLERERKKGVSES